MNNGMKARAINHLHHYCPRLKGRVILKKISNITRSVALIALAFIRLPIHNLQRAPEVECKISTVIENRSVLFNLIFCELHAIFHSTVFGIPFFAALSYH